MTGDGNDAVSVLEAGIRAGVKNMLEASYKKVYKEAGTLVGRTD